METSQRGKEKKVWKRKTTLGSPTTYIQDTFMLQWWRQRNTGIRTKRSVKQNRVSRHRPHIHGKLPFHTQSLTFERHPEEVFGTHVFRSSFSFCADSMINLVSRKPAFLLIKDYHVAVSSWWQIQFAIWNVDPPTTNFIGEKTRRWQLGVIKADSEPEAYYSIPTQNFLYGRPGERIKELKKIRNGYRIWYN